MDGEHTKVNNVWGSSVGAAKGQCSTIQWDGDSKQF